MRDSASRLVRMLATKARGWRAELSADADGLWLVRRPCRGGAREISTSAPVGGASMLGSAPRR